MTAKLEELDALVNALEAWALKDAECGFVKEAYDIRQAAALLRAQAEDNARLREAAQTVFDGLLARLDAATKAGNPLPIFNGIADLHYALTVPPDA